MEFLQEENVFGLKASLPEMNKFKKKNEVLTRNILNSKDESNEKSLDTLSDIELEKTHKEKLNE